MNNTKDNTKGLNDSGKSKCKFSHFTLESRKQLEDLLNEQANLKTISIALNKSESSISREIKRNRTRKENHRHPNHCIYVKDCFIKHLCAKMSCSTTCKNCSFGKNCNEFCEKYVEKKCNKLEQFPYVCNGCSDKKHCVLNFYNYVAVDADRTARIINSECRKGIDLSEEEFKDLDTKLVNGTKKGQSVEHICSYGDFGVCPRTVRNYIDKGYTTTTKMDTPRGVRYKKRKNNIPKSDLKKVRACKVGRDYASFVRFMMSTPYTIYSELDTVEGAKKDEKKPLLLTILIVRFNIFLCFLIPDGSSQRKKAIFDYLDKQLGEDYSTLFSVILTDNGTEFYSPEDIEINFETGNVRSHVYYCNPYQSWEKGAIEVCHELLRRIIPKGHSLRDLTDESTILINNVINNYVRSDLGGKSSYQLFCEAFPNNGKEILSKIKIRYLEPELIELTPALIHNQKLLDMVKKY